MPSSTDHLMVTKWRVLSMCLRLVDQAAPRTELERACKTALEAFLHYEPSEVGQGAKALHWSEKISSLWDELPFLRGVNLKRRDQPVSVSWLDRVNSFVSYAHVLKAATPTLVLLQPSVANSPLHPIVSLVGL